MPRPQPPSRLGEAIDTLVDAAAEAGLDPAVARDEGLRVAAALAESVSGAAVGWAAVARPDLDGLADLGAANVAFFDAASRGRRWRDTPTDLLAGLVGARNRYAADYAEALAGVASAALLLGHPEPWAIERARASAAGYLAAASIPGLAAPGSPAVPPVRGSRAPAASPRSPAFGSDFPVPAFPSTASPGLPSLPPGPGTDAVLRDWGYVRETNDGMPLSPASGEGGVSPPPGSVGGAAAPTATAGEDATAQVQPDEPAKSVDELLAELDAMIGLARVKREIHRQVALLSVERLRTEAGLKAPKMSRHLVFVGNPGTGKTTVARLIGAIYRALKLLPKGQLIEVDRSELVAGFVGQTAMKTAEVCATAVDGVLFIDEAYALAGDQFAQEAVNTLVKEMEDHRENLVVIVAGYPDPMVSFIAQNPGLASRFTTTVEFDDYTDDELVAILRSIADGSDYELTDDAEKRVRMTLEASARGPAFGNGRFARNQFEHAVGRHAWRLKDTERPSRDDLRLLLPEDFFDVPEEPTPGQQTAPDPYEVDPAAEVSGPPAGDTRDDPDTVAPARPAGLGEVATEPTGSPDGRSAEPDRPARRAEPAEPDGPARPPSEDRT